MSYSTDQAHTRCSDLFVIRCTPALRAALDRAADRGLISASAYVRGALLMRLRADGLLDDQTHPTT